ncbi:MAG: hypothetical protein ACYC6A_14025 [Armatimonadota bacterium]
MARYLVLTCALAFFLSPLLAQDVPPLKISLVGLRVIAPEEAMRLVELPYAEGGVKELIPPGVEIVPMPDIKGMLLRTADQGVLALTEKIITAIDAKRQQRYADSTLIFVELPKVDALALRGSMHDNLAEQELRAQVAGKTLPALTPWLTREELKAKLDSLQQAGRATVRTVEPVVFFDGEATAIDLRNLASPCQGLLCGDVRVSEDNLTLSSAPILRGLLPKTGQAIDVYRGVGPTTFTVRRGCAMEVGTEALAAPEGAEKQLLLFVIPREIGLALVRDPDKLSNLPPLF